MGTRTVARALIVVFATVLLAAGCDQGSGWVDAGPGHSPATLTNSHWAVVSVNGEPPVPNFTPTISFLPTSASGSGGCNSFGGQYHYDPMTGGIAFKELGMTLIGCLDNRVGAFETAYVQALGVADHVAIDATGRLVLSGRGNVIVLAPTREG